MSDETVEIETIRKYLLGELPEAEAERIEKWYFADGRAVDEIWAAFGELAEERLSGALSEGEARRFEQRLRSSPALREMFENEKALRDYAVRITAEASRQVENGASVAGGRRQWRLLAAFFKSPRLLVASFVALIALGGLGAWFALREGASADHEGSQQAGALDQKSPDSPAQPPADPQPQPQSVSDANGRPVEGKKSAVAQSDQRRPAPGTGAETTATFLLLASGTRDGEGYTTLEIPARTETVQLELEPPTDDCGVFSAVLETESGEELQRWKKLRARRAHSALRVASLRVSAGFLKNAGYVIKLECASGLKNPASAAQYRFKVKKNIS